MCYGWYGLRGLLGECGWSVMLREVLTWTGLKDRSLHHDVFPRFPFSVLLNLVNNRYAAIKYSSGSVSHIETCF